MAIGNVFTQIMMFSLKKVDDLRTRAREKRNHTFRAQMSQGSKWARGSIMLGVIWLFFIKP